MSHDHQAMSPYSTFIAGLCRFGLQSIGRVTVSGLDDLPGDGPLIVAANHMSNADPPFIGGWLSPALGRRPTFLAKDVLFQGPLGRSEGGGKIATLGDAGGDPGDASLVATVDLPRAGLGLESGDVAHHHPYAGLGGQRYA